jgi:hypothetical protein
MAIGTTVSGLRSGRSELIRYAERPCMKVGGRFVMLASLFALQRAQIRPDEHAATPGRAAGRRWIMRHSGNACALRLILWSRSVCYFPHSAIVRSRSDTRWPDDNDADGFGGVFFCVNPGCTAILARRLSRCSRRNCQRVRTLRSMVSTQGENYASCDSRWRGRYGDRDNRWVDADYRDASKGRCSAGTIGECDHRGCASQSQ